MWFPVWRCTDDTNKGFFVWEEAQIIRFYRRETRTTALQRDRKPGEEEEEGKKDEERRWLGKGQL